MKTFNIKINIAENNSVEPVQLREVGIDDAVAFISGVCDSDIDIVNNGICTVSPDSGNTWSTAKCESQVVRRMGYITIDDVVYYVEDGSVIYDNSAYTATYIKNDTGNKFEDMHVLISGTSYEIQDGQASQWYNVQKLRIENKTPEALEVEDCQSIQSQRYITLNDTAYPLRQTGDSLFIVFEGGEYSGSISYENSDFGEIIFDYPEIGLEGSYGINEREVSSKYGNYLNITTPTDIRDVKVGDLVKIEEVGDGLSKFYVETVESAECVNYYGVYYPVKPDMKVCAVLDEQEYAIDFDDELLYPDMMTGHLTDYPEVYVSAVTSNGVVSELYKRTLVHNGNDTFFSNETIDFKSYSGITVGDVNYFIKDDVNVIGDYVAELKYAELPSRYKGYFSVGLANTNTDTLVIYPFNDAQSNYVRNGLLGWIADNYRNLHFSIVRTLFGTKITEDEYYHLVNKDVDVFLKPFIRTINLPLPLSNSDAINLNVEQRQEDLLDERLWAQVNQETDIERDIYSPVFYKYKKNDDGSIATDSLGEAIIESTKLLNKIKFNLHFRTRNLDDWSVNEDNVELDNDGYCSWNCLDHYFNLTEDNTVAGDNYGKIVYSNEQRKLYADDIANHADLLYFLNFTDNDVFYQKSALAKSFIRLSFFDSPKPNTQSLLWTSTVFFDEGACYTKFINNSENYNYQDFDKNNSKNLYNVGVKREEVEKLGRQQAPYYKPTFNDDNRLCAEFPITNKHKTLVSSEGYYIYIYKDYSQYLHERKIYMRVDFNHAKIGQSVPMMFLHHYDENGNETKYQANCSDDVFKAREGIEMDKILNYLYTPIKVVYSEELGRYTYHFEQLIPAEEESDYLNINLFEVKYKDQSK